MDPQRVRAVGFFTALFVVSVFFMVISLPFLHALGPLLVIFITALVLALCRKRHPELFKWRSSKNVAENDERPDMPIPHETQSHTVYMMLVSMNASSQSRITIDDSPFMLGDSDEANYRIRDAYVSREHMLVEFDPETKRRWVTDRSRHGVYLNGQRIPKGVKTSVQHGDRLQLGSTTWMVEFVYY